MPVPLSPHFVAGMARKHRLEFPGAIYHLINRGNYGSWIFKDDGAKGSFGCGKKGRAFTFNPCALSGSDHCKGER
ncbi:MAG: hypothetical protein ACREIA_17705 [Opitutaceae bacterium]